jgi:hypothetical protein
VKGNVLRRDDFNARVELALRLSHAAIIRRTR